MKTREEVARFVDAQFNPKGYDCTREKNRCWHYGRQDVRELMDFIFGGEPETEEQKISGVDGYRGKLPKVKPDAG